MRKSWWLAGRRSSSVRYISQVFLRQSELETIVGGGSKANKTLKKTKKNCFCVKSYWFNISISVRDGII